ncbi:hypothetical protein HELRODRAFT_87437 [Helobdella robusta]|uniref:Uncharacterized protein n=1 Tax=Helobdella robusta TaxID=6412 RepID=T1G6Q0_HELRO|nr:hypothetical protein HELRODRAFT_87437 [Helobdella robusta]ESN94870.1 hypothetical protein HELRODRAFT_87437 [Helobdella robusta]
MFQFFFDQLGEIIVATIFITIYELYLLKKPKDIKGNVVLITGAGGGIGRQLALKFAAHKTKLALLDIDKSRCDETASEVRALGSTCYSYECDVSIQEAVASVARLVRRDLGEVDIVVNNPCRIDPASHANLKGEESQPFSFTNIFGSLWIIGEFLPVMNARKKGHIVNIFKTVAYFLVDYVLTKFGIRGMSESLAEDFVAHKKFGIHISIVYPTDVDSQLFRKVTFAKNFTPLSVETAVDIMMEDILANRKHIFVPNNLWRAKAINK